MRYTVVEVLKRDHLPAPIFRDTGTSFIVTVYGRPRSQDAQARPYAQLNDTQRQILTFVRSQGEVSPAAIRQLIGERARRSIQRDIQRLVEAHLITAVGEGRALRYYPASGSRKLAWLAQFGADLARFKPKVAQFPFCRWRSSPLRSAYEVMMT